MGGATLLLLFAGSGGAVTYPDLLSAVLARLRSFNGGSVAAAFGDNGTTANKFQGDKVFGSPAGPYARVTEIAETLNPETAGDDGIPHDDGMGQLQVDVFAPGKLAARTLRSQVIAALKDAPLAFTDGALKGIWPTAMHMIPTESVGPDGTPTLYHAVVTFTYYVDRTFV